MCAPLELGRGCPFACEFCSTNDFFRRRFRLKSPETVIAQMRQLYRAYGCRTFDLVHDMFTIDRKRVVAFCDAMLASGEQFFWGCSARTDCIDDELIALMARAGCRGIFFGVEAGSSRLQRLINKNLDLGEAASRIESCSAHRVPTTVSMITGFPEETKEDLGETISFLIDALRFDTTRPELHLLAPLAATPVHAKHRDSLTFDDMRADASGEGWQQDAEDRDLVLRYPDIFPNFYAVPTRFLERTYLRQLKDFVLYSHLRFRWLLVALNQLTGDILQVFEAWQRWLSENVTGAGTPENAIPYYNRVAFRKDFLRFMRTRYLQHVGETSHVLGALVDLELALDQFADTSADLHSQRPQPGAPHEDLTDSSILRLSPSTQVTQLGTDPTRVIDALRAKRPLSTVPAQRTAIAIQRLPGGRIRLLRLSSIAAELLSALAAGECRLGQLATRYPRAACVHAIRKLLDEGVVHSVNARDPAWTP